MTNRATDGAKNFFIMIQRIVKLPNQKNQKHCIKYNMTKDSYFAHPENILIAMLVDENSRVYQLRVNKIIAIRQGMEDFVTESDNFEGGLIDQQDSASSSTSLIQHTSTVGKFLLPKLTFNAKSFYKLDNLTAKFIYEPLVTNTSWTKKLKIINQALKLKIILVMICQRTRSRKLMKQVESQMQFAV